MKVLILLSLFFASLNQSSMGTEFSQHPHSRARLIQELDGVAPNSSQTIALHIKLDEGWHSYWRNPGDSGAAPIFNFTGPPHLDVSQTLYPIPKRLPVPPLMTFGYEQEVMYLFEVSHNSSASPETSQPLTLDAEWLVCRIECIPAFGTFTLDVPTKDSPTKAPFAQDIDAFKTRLPQKKPQLKLSLTLDPQAQKLRLSIQEPTMVVQDFLPFQNTPIDLTQPTIQKNPDGSTNVLLDQTIAFQHGIQFQGLLIYDEAGQRQSTVIEANFQAPAEPSPHLGKILLFAFLGGLLLNLMPCVFPVISIKLLGLIKHAHGDQSLIKRQSLAYVSGVVISFIILGGILVGLRAGGAMLGWGFQLQSPVFIMILCFLFAFMAIGFLGILSFDLPLGSLPSRLYGHDGLAGQFFTGVLSTVVASPCTAPFMGFAMGAAISQPPPIILTTFATIGLGLGSPYLGLMISPGFLKLLPKPGPWMDIIKQLMAFPMLLTCLWLLWVLGQVAGTDAIISTLLGFLWVAFGLWINRFRAKGTLGVLITFAGISWSILWVHGAEPPPHHSTTNGSQRLEWHPYEAASVEAAQRQKQAVFINFTADWCITCKVNENVTFTDQKVQDFMALHRIKAFKGDWTRRDPEITKVLTAHDRIGVPLYLFWPPGAKTPVVLPEVLTTSIFIDQIKGALDHKK